MKFAFLSVTYAGQFYKGPALTIVEQIRKARALGFDGLSIETKRPVASPLDLTRQDRQAIKAAAAAEGIEICAIESLSNFASPLMEERENNLAMMRLVVDLAVGPRRADRQGLRRVAGGGERRGRDGVLRSLREGQLLQVPVPGRSAPLATGDLGPAGVGRLRQERGVTLALQNHAPVLRPGYEDTLAMMREVDRPNIGLCLDAPLFHERQSDDYIREAVRACRPHIVLTHFGAWNFSEGTGGAIVQQPAPSVGGPINYQVFLEELQRAGYEGYLVSEYLPAVRCDHRIAGIADIDQANVQALTYLKRLVPAPQVA